MRAGHAPRKERMRHALLLAALVAATFCACGSNETSDGRAEIRVEVDERGYSPAEVTAPANEAVRLVFTRTSDEGCGRELVFPDLGIRRELPLDEAVAVDLTMPASGSVRFTCGMDMYQGSVVAR
jgi:plastocyanin domain-containing protein